MTTRGLLTAWLAGRAKEKLRENRLPAEIDAAIRQENFYTYAVGGDAAFMKYADLPVTKPADIGDATLALVYARLEEMDFFILGTGTAPWPLPAVLRVKFHDAHVSIDAMMTGPAMPKPAATIFSPAR